MSSPAFAVGIDLGTTHSAVFQSSLQDEASRPEPVRIAQLVARDRLDTLPLLPSFLYTPHSGEGVVGLPWSSPAGADAAPEVCIGAYARQRAAESVGRVVSSAKSWLSETSVDARAAVLPVAPAEGVQQLSALSATRLLVSHLRRAWELQSAADLSDQDVVLTVPASFDAAARELTVEAAAAAGLGQLTLLEEPQAAFYAWLERQGDLWRSQLRVGDRIVVVDVGGGTTDFTAILLTEEGGRLEPRRIAVGQHILLGGDNMDLALAFLIRQKLEKAGRSLDAWQLGALPHAARAAKETLLGEQPPPSTTVVVPSRGSQLLGGSLRCELSREEVVSVLVDGFFPAVARDTEPRRRARTALRQKGLSYAEDPSVTTHLAAFLRDQRGAAGEESAPLLVPTHLLFNGGVFKSSLLRERVVDTVNEWLRSVGAGTVRVLEHSDYDLAVARGASYFALARRGRGIRVRGGTAQSYYVGIESPTPAVPGFEPPVAALCVAPFGMEEGTSVDLESQDLVLVVGERVTFRFFGSSTRRGDKSGVLVETPDRGLQELAPVSVALPAVGRALGEPVPITLRACLTEVGTLSLVALPLVPQHPGEAWTVELSLRNIQ